MNALQQLIFDNRAGSGAFLPSVCSAHPDVLAASMRFARSLPTPLIVEATSNQVNQFGGYTGMTPSDFIHFVKGIAKDTGFDEEKLIFGGDHLGPQVWKAQNAETAMAHAADMMKAYVEAGFTKIHLDCSEGCQGEGAQVSDEVSSARAAELARICEANAPNKDALLYIVGTEVPPPGGARIDHGAIVPTAPSSAGATLAAQKAAFDAAGLAAAWKRVIGLVVQPGLEFGADEIYRFPENAPDTLSAVLENDPQLSFEAHSTDYQQPSVFEAIGRRHFVVQKVGPALTFAYREAIYALSSIDNFINGNPHISEVLEEKMLAKPEYWQKHYEGDDSRLKFLRHFGFADRIRYYWPQVTGEVAALEVRLLQNDVPEPVMWQYFDQNVRARAAAMQSDGMNWVKAFIYAKIQSRLADYYPNTSSV